MKPLVSNIVIKYSYKVKQEVDKMFKLINSNNLIDKDSPRGCTAEAEKLTPLESRDNSAYKFEVYQ